MILKNDTVKLDGSTPELLHALGVAERIHRDLTGREAVITSLNDGQHKSGSKHYEGNAADLRIWYTSAVHDTYVWVYRIRKALGADYDVIYGTPGHKDHIHLEYDPK